MQDCVAINNKENNMNQTMKKLKMMVVIMSLNHVVVFKIKIGAGKRKQ